ncbi:MAG: ABC transporter ATP-binding protein [Deltaproteobacteria bacterium]|nr:ABC transporter ATP-binding protein [Deltaproteobacteria bacterium]
MNQVLFKTEGLVKRFGSLPALSGISLSIGRGELCALIGPNGSGKTTFFNVVTGKFKPDGGRVFFDGQDISGWPPECVLPLAMARGFQVANLFPQLSVFENVMVPIIRRHKRHNRFFTQAKRQKNIAEEAMDVLHSIGMEKLETRRAASLSHGDRKRLDMGIALAWQPKLLLLDEPTAGLSPEETQSMVQLIKQLHAKKGLSILFTEHNMEVVFSISQKITVLQMGRVIAEGKPEEVRENSAVIDAYLGRQT